MAGGRLLIICASDECGGPARLLQRRLEDELQCEVAIGSDDIGTWRNEVDFATRGVMLLQTRSVLRDPVRLLQLLRPCGSATPSYMCQRGGQRLRIRQGQAATALAIERAAPE